MEVHYNPMYRELQLAEKQSEEDDGKWPVIGYYKWQVHE